MTDKYDRLLNPIYSRYEQKIDQLGDLSNSKPPKTIIIFLVIFLSLITSVFFTPVRQTLSRLLPFSSATVCPHSRKADIQLTITHNQHCYVIPMSTFSRSQRARSPKLGILCYFLPQLSLRVTLYLLICY